MILKVFLLVILLRPWFLMVVVSGKESLVCFSAIASFS
jgi:hypothetical protein